MRPYLAMGVLAIGVTLPGAAAAQTVVKSGSEDQIAVEVTVYNDNLGLVKETRRLDLLSGAGELQFMDVAAHVMPVTVHARSLTAPEAFTVQEQNYEYDLLNASKLMDKYVGKRIKLIDRHEYADRQDIIDATLLSNNQGPIYQIGNEIYLGHPGLVVLPSLPENLIAKPTLTWLYEGTGNKPHDLEVSYLTEQISWKADYVAVVNQGDSASDLSGWVTVDNRSGAMYRNAVLTLVAGKVHRAQEREYFAQDAMRLMESRAAAASFVEQAFFEYHLYDLQRKTTIKDNQTKQIRLLEASGVGTQKELVVYGIQGYYTTLYQERQQKQPVNVFLKFKNSKDNRLGMPLPAGTMRLYKKDQGGRLQFIGEDRIEHTPKDEEVRLKIGEAFDVVAERRQTHYQRVTTHLHESAWEVTLRNHKEEAVTVGLVEPLFGSWQVIESSHPYKKLDAHTIRFDVAVPKDGEVKVTYRVRVGY